MRTFRRTAFLTGSAAAAVLAFYPMLGQAEAQTLPLPGQYNWGGFYAGVHGGGIWSDRDDKVSYDDCGPFTDLLGGGGGFLADSADDRGCFDAVATEGPNVGGVFPTFDLDDDYVAYTGHDEDDNDFSGLGGGHVGYNWQAGRFVFGLEADASGVFGGGNRNEVNFDYFNSLDDEYSEVSQEAVVQEGLPELFNYDGSGTVTRESEIDWIATIRGRAGATFGSRGQFLFYGTAGLAIAGVSTSTSANFDRAVDSDCDPCEFEDDDDDDDDVKFGFTVGAGAEAGLTDHIRLGVEYLYTHIDDDDDGGSVTFEGDSGRQFNVNVDGGGLEDLHTFRARLTYAFGGP